MAFSRAAFPPSPWCSAIVSTIWVEMRRKGFREVMGSWKIMAIRLPRTFRISRLPILSTSLPWNRISPPSIRPAGSG